MSRIGLGINTGGTYTDAVIVDLGTNKVLMKNKSLTTYEDLSIGIDSAISALKKDLVDKVSVVSLSSTLATNFVVEGKGRRIALIAAGSKYDGSVKVDKYISIKGAHDVYGKQTDVLDEKAAEAFLEEIRGTVDAVAITSFMSVYNPNHEKRLKKMAERILGVPVVCGHELSSDLGFSERAVTAIMNANLLPAIGELVDSVKKVFAKHGISAPMMIVKGDGSLMSEEMAMIKPVDTIISGSAASIIGAKTLSGFDDAVVIDMGGTTTDIGILKDGLPMISEEGATIAGKNTKVLAANIFTAGLGGDSRILVLGKNMTVCEKRVMPLCIAASEWPELEEKLRNVAESAKGPYFALAGATDTVQDIEYFVKLKDPQEGVLSGRELEFLLKLGNGPLNLREGAALLGTHPMAIDTDRMEMLGFVQRIGLTPTDILHAEGSYTEFNVNASKYGVSYLARMAKMNDDDFIKLVKERVINKLTLFMIQKVLSDEIGQTKLDDPGREFVRRFITGEPAFSYECSLNLTKPIIGIGAPAGAYIPQVAEKLHTKLFLSEDSDVGNAVGAITGRIVETVLMTVRPARFFSTEDNPKSSVQSSYGIWDFGTLTEAIKFAEQKGVEIATENAKANGAANVETFFKRREDSYAINDSGEIVKIEIWATAVGNLE